MKELTAAELSASLARWNVMDEAARARLLVAVVGAHAPPEPETRRLFSMAEAGRQGEWAAELTAVARPLLTCV